MGALDELLDLEGLGQEVSRHVLARKMGDVKFTSLDGMTHTVQTHVDVTNEVGQTLTGVEVDDGLIVTEETRSKDLAASVAENVGEQMLEEEHGSVRVIAGNELGLSGRVGAARLSA